MRLFIAINLPSDVRSAIWRSTAGVRQIAPDLTWVPEERIHLTLRFLGEQPETNVAPLAGAMDQVAARRPSSRVLVGSVGAFPDFRRPRVVWIGVDADSVLALQRDVEAACVALGNEKEDRSFRPHLTLARVKTRLSTTELRRLEMAAGQVRFSGAFTMTSIDLMQSVSDKDGSRYIVLHRSPLRGHDQ